MKKIISIIIAILVLTVCCVPQTFATTQDYQTEIKYIVPDTYMLYIPSEINIGEPAEIYAENVNITTDKKVVVRMNGIDELGRAEVFNVNDGQQKLSVAFTGENAAAITSLNNVVGEFNKGDTQSDTHYTINSYADAYDTLAYDAGEYIGNISFTASCEPID